VDEVLSDVNMIQRIRELIPKDKRLQTQLRSEPAKAGHLLLVNGVVYNNGLIEVPADEDL
jgi:hypothetical protein